ncbi:transposase (fragment) [Xenorhabdus poinarii G6]|uniref:Transposase n=1 Tax=Xenorhabdus poinarii G6 TaxID=1354304 RepID=A0A068QZT1_9GAMM
MKTTNQMQAFLLEFGLSMPKGIAVIRQLSEVIAENDVPSYLVQRFQRLHAHPSISPITASVLASWLGDGKQYSHSREFAVSTGGVFNQ